MEKVVNVSVHGQSNEADVRQMLTVDHGIDVAPPKPRPERDVRSEVKDLDVNGVHVATSGNTRVSKDMGDQSKENMDPNWLVNADVLNRRHNFQPNLPHAPLMLNTMEAKQGQRPNQRWPCVNSKQIHIGVSSDR